MRHSLWQRFFAFVLVASFFVPSTAWSASPSPLGTARAARGVKASLDQGSTWLEMKGNALPVFAGTEVRTGGGAAAIELKDGSRIEVLPFSAVQFEAAGADARIALTYGRVSFHLHPRSKAQIVTPVAKLDSIEQGVVSGEVFVTGDGVMGLKMAQGRLNVQPTTPGGQTMVASVEPVFVPKRPIGQGPLFAADGPLTPPANAKPVFAPSGESVGYLAPDGSLAIHPGFTADLTQPFSQKLVRLALATISDDELRSDATPLFDVNGGYVGYLSGPVFYAQTLSHDNSQAGTNQAGGDSDKDNKKGGPAISPKFAIGAGAVAAVAGAAGMAAGGGSGSGGGGKGSSAAPPVLTPPSATPFGPRR